MHTFHCEKSIFFFLFIGLRGRGLLAHFFIAGNQLIYTHMEGISQDLQHFNIRQIVSVFPSGNGFVSNADFFAQGLLGQPFPAAQIGMIFPNFTGSICCFTSTERISQFRQKVFPTDRESLNFRHLFRRFTPKETNNERDTYNTGNHIRCRLSNLNSKNADSRYGN